MTDDDRTGTAGTPRANGAAPDALFDGPGEMRALCRAHDWAATPLGPVARWSLGLRTLVATLLASRHPMFLFWGPALVQLYNDAYRPSLADGGRHPRALGARGAEFWTEIWEIIGPQIDQVMRGGEATWHEDHLVPIERNGRIEEVYWTYSYSPAFDDAGRVGGVLVVCQETTRHVVGAREREMLLADAVAAEAALRASEARQRFLLALSDRLRPLVDPEAIQYEAARLLGAQLGASRVGYAEIEADGLHSIVTRNYTDGVQGIEGRFLVADYSPTLLDALRAGRTVVRGDVARDATLTDVERAAHAGIAVGATVDLPLLKEGRLVAVLFMHDRAAREWTADELALLEAVAERTWEAVERARAEAHARAGEARLRLALDVAELGTWEIDLSTGETTLDARGAEIVGMEPGERDDAGRAQAEHVLPEDHPRLQAEIAAGVASGAGGAAFDLAYRVLGRDGRVRHVASRARLLADAAGRPVRLVGTNRDVTAEREAEAERERLLAAERAARAEAEAANRAKAEFLAVMSHELRTPLNAIGGYAELLELGIRGPITPEQRSDLARIQQSQRHLLGLINGVLNYARVEAGAVHYALEVVVLDEVLATCEALIAPQVRARGLALDHAPCGLGWRARADREKLQQIVLNLLTNAVKFTEPGGRVVLRCAAGRDGRFLCVQVSDTGIGIAPEQLARVFEPFVQVDATLTRTREGTGLGLTISRDLARGMGGELTVESAPGTGSTFTLSLPRVAM